jgi:voltage-gated potassium channel
MNLQKRVDRILNHQVTPIALVYRGISVLLVLSVCVTFVMGTYNFSQSTLHAIRYLDTGITVLFLIDYLVRWWAKEFSIRYLFTFYAIIDLIAIIPLFSPIHWQFIRILRLFRVLRLVRFMYWGKKRLVSEVHLGLARIFVTLFCIIFIASGMIYEMEPSTFFTFFEALYFSMVTMTTVGYGDIVPMSTAGRVVTLLMITSGIVVVPWQLTALFFQLMGRSNVKCQGCGLAGHAQEAHYCRQCGHQLEESAV